MWFGNLVTMRWWDDLWLNESFAEWASTTCQAEATEWTEAWTTFGTFEKDWAYRQDQLSSTHPIVAPIRDLRDVEVNFDGITYAKGASVLKQLVAYVGREPFTAGLRSYFAKHAWGNTTLADLLDRARGDERPRPARLERGLAGDRRGQHAAPRPRGRRRRHHHLGRHRADVCRGLRDAAAASPRRRSVCRRRRPARPHRTARARRGGRADRGPRARRAGGAGPAPGQRRRPHATPRSASTSARSRRRWPTRAASTARSPARSSSPRRGT